jgi:hypothetical protein
MYKDEAKLTERVCVTVRAEQRNCIRTFLTEFFPLRKVETCTALANESSIKDGCLDRNGRTHGEPSTFSPRIREMRINRTTCPTPIIKELSNLFE